MKPRGAPQGAGYQTDVHVKFKCIPPCQEAAPGARLARQVRDEPQSSHKVRAGDTLARPLAATVERVEGRFHPPMRPRTVARRPPRRRWSSMWAPAGPRTEGEVE